jgi:phthalate 4,5-dioxygenase reductase component
MPTATLPSAVSSYAKTDALFAAQVTSVRSLASGITLIDLVKMDGSALPSFTAGSHIAVRTPSGAHRHYSLCSDPSEAAFWQIAVKREGRGRGGSLSLVDSVRVGSELLVSLPANNFRLNDGARQFLFVAGGIGITPIVSMLYTLKANGIDNAKLVYLVRDEAAFDVQLRELLPPKGLTIHFDHGDPDQQFDLWPLFEKTSPTHVYCCGPKPLMDSVRDMTGHWPQKQIHFESFGSDTAPRASDEAFTVVINSSGLSIEVESHQSILEALRANGITVPSSCESGTCGSCRTGLLDGQADHRDLVLTEEERDSQVMVCVSRACSSRLLLDL